MAVPNPSTVAHTAIVIGPGLSPLEGARIDVTINDLLAEFTLTQQFRNATAKDIEAVFTFPIPMDAVFLGLSATLGERELEGRVIERQKAAMTTMGTRKTRPRLPMGFTREPSCHQAAQAQARDHSGWQPCCPAPE